MLNSWVNRQQRLRLLSSLFFKPAEFYSEQDEYGRTIIHRTASDLHLEKSYSMLQTDWLFGMVLECPLGALLLQESEGETILHHCVRRCADGILGHDTWANDRWMSQARVWEDLVGILLERCPEAAEVRNNDGNTPLHIAAHRANRWSTAAIKALAEARPSATEIENDTGETPLATLCRIYSKGLSRALEQTVSPKQIFGDTSTLHSAPLDCCMLTQIKILLKASMDTRNGQSVERGKRPTFMAQMCLAMPTCPRDVMQLALKMYPHELFGMDESGNYGLHLAAANPAVRGELSKRMMESMVQQNCLIAATSNKRGQYPLHLAASSGKQWDEGISALYYSAPHIMGKMDPISGMFPFMLAACSSDNGKGEAAPEAARSKLNTIYQLLRVLPEIERFSFH
mmetsp:Transcript_44404/g.135360  ORF Transcript_44404/g.135360 Transcript_44404/m.135360 type:complete len:399 (-) Transcript_44404:179-1375(-)